MTMPDGFLAYVRFNLPHLRAERIVLRFGFLRVSVWVGFVETGYSEDAARTVGLTIGLSEFAALNAAQKAYRSWYQRQLPMVEA